MIVYPAIDVRNGSCVRLEQGRMDSATLFNRDPADQALRFAGMGFTHLHVVDLDGAFTGEPINAAAVRAILDATDGMHIQLGGGIRTRADIDHWLDTGIARVILGTLAVRAPSVVREAAADHGSRIWVGVDSRDGRTATDGWAADSAIPASEIALRAEDSGAGGLIVTDIGRDGIKSGINLDFIAGIAGRVSIPVIASGGVAGVDDIIQLAEHGGIAGVIVGRALYDGDIDPAAALAAARSDYSRVR